MYADERLRSIGHIDITRETKILQILLEAEYIPTAYSSHKYPNIVVATYKYRVAAILFPQKINMEDVCFRMLLIFKIGLCKYLRA